MRTTDACPTWCKGHSVEELSAGGDTTLLHLGADDDFEGIALGNLTAEDGLIEYHVEFDYAGDHSAEELRELAKKLAAMTRKLLAAADLMDGGFLQGTEKEVGG